MGPAQIVDSGPTGVLVGSRSRARPTDEHVLDARPSPPAWSVPVDRATLAANLETAVTVIWVRKSRWETTSPSSEAASSDSCAAGSLAGVARAGFD
jgi:hypothetical protein